MKKYLFTILSVMLLFFCLTAKWIHADSNYATNNTTILNQFFKDNQLQANEGSQYIVTRQANNEYCIEERDTNGDPNISHLKNIYFYTPKEHQGYVINNNNQPTIKAQNTDPTFEHQVDTPTYVTNELPQTGNQNNIESIILGIISLFGDLFLIKTKKEI